MTPQLVWRLWNKDKPRVPAEHRTTIPLTSRPHSCHYTDYATPAGLSLHKGQTICTALKHICIRYVYRSFKVYIILSAHRQL